MSDAGQMKRYVTERYDSLLQNAPCATLVVDAGGHIVCMNAEGEHIFGWREAELVGQTIETLIPDRLRAVHQRHRSEFPTPLRRMSARSELLARRKDGSEFPAVVGLTSLRGNGDTLTAVFVTDNTRQRRVEERYRALFEQANDGVLVLDLDGRILECNHVAATLAQRAPEELLGKPFWELIDPSSVQAETARFARLRETGTARADGVAIRSPQGMAVVVDASAVLVKVGSEQLVFVIVRDVTAQRKLQTQLLVSERMASVGMLASGVAHEINNPLASVLANLELAAGELAQAASRPGQAASFDSILDELRDARESAEVVRQIVRDLRIFSRSEEDARHAVDLPRVLDSTLRMAWNEIRHRARLEKAFGPIPSVSGNESRLGQVFLNLVVNAAQSIDEGHAQDNVIRVSTSTAADGRAQVEVSDSGAGMAPDVLHRLFTPFFTTKPVGVGTGLGLAICHRIIAGLGGEITVDSKPGSGTVFRVLLPPLTSPHDERSRAEAAPAPAAARRGRVLVVDDEPAVARSVSRCLATEHDVVAVTDGAEALARIVAGERFDVVLSDLMMPEMTGMDLYEQVQVLDPAQAARFVFLSGGAFTPRARAFLDRATNQRIEKPFDVQNLRALVNNLVR